MSSIANSRLASPSCELPITEAILYPIRWFVALLQLLPRQHTFGLGDRLIAKQQSGWLGQQWRQTA